MANTFMTALKNDANKTLTENGATTYKSTMSGLLDLFALGGAYRSRSDNDCIFLFKKAFDEDPAYALKCLFYLRDVRGGQGERRFFRVVTKWLADNETEAMRRNLGYVSEFGRWDDLYTFVGTRLEKDAFAAIRKQLELDVQCKAPSLLAKWLKSENASSRETAWLGNKTRQYLGMSHRQYRKTLSILRERIRVLERLMSANRWDEIEFDKIPSKAGLVYKNAFARRDIIKEKYKAFAEDKTTKVNANALYPYEIVKQAMAYSNFGYYYGRPQVEDQELDRKMLEKYWEGLKDTFDDYVFNGLAVCDVSGSMYGQPMAAAIALSMYCAEKNTGPFANHFFTFSDKPSFVKIEGIDFVDKVCRISRADWGNSTNIEAVFDKMLEIAKVNHLIQDEIPERVVILSDMEFNDCVTGSSYTNRQSYGWYHKRYEPANEVLFETIEKRWHAAGYEMPGITFWNLDARQDNIPMKAEGRVQLVSGFSQNLFEQVMKGKDAYSLMFDTLDNERYAPIN